MSFVEIADVFAWEALDSRGNPTVGCEVVLSDGARGAAHVPSGASTGAHEAHELRDGGDRYDGRGVRTAVGNVVGPLADLVRGHDVADLPALDEHMGADGGVDRYGANAVLGISLATALARAASRGRPLHQDQADDPSRRPLLPMPMVNIVSGGAHAGGILDIQDVLVAPIAARSFGTAIELAARVRRATAELARSRGLTGHLVADEGGLGPELAGNREAIALVCDGIEAAGLRAGVDVAIALDVAATEFRRAERYELARDGLSLSSVELVELVVGWAAEFPIVSIEDPLGEDDWTAWTEITGRLPGMQLVGDDLFVTNSERLTEGIARRAGSAVLVKPNQSGLLTRARDVVRLAGSAGYTTVVSARSGETEDSWLADLAVGWRAGQIKVGSTTRSERTAKWNRLLYLEQRHAGAVDFAAFPGQE